MKTETQSKMDNLIQRIGELAEDAQKLADLERRLEDHDGQSKVVFDAIRALMSPPEKPRKKIGFEAKEPKGRYGKRTGKKHS